uniref:protein-tyrosine phosphatase family protein n=1 Tax=Roseivirga sp. TaxID=1964215 RepID=UPI00404880FC
METDIQNAQAWLNSPFNGNLDESLAFSNQLLVSLQKLITENDGLKRTLGPLIGKIKSTQKTLMAIELVDWIPVNNGHLAIGHRPSTKLVSDLKLQNATHILTLLSEHEGALLIKTTTIQRQMEWLWFPMESAKPPTEGQLKVLAQVFVKMNEILSNGGRVYLHCSAGIHRTGMISYAFLRFIGNEHGEAIQLLQALRTVTGDGVGEERVTWGNSIQEKLKAYQ